MKNANKLFSAGKYRAALRQYHLLRDKFPEMDSEIAFNIALTESRLGLTRRNLSEVSLDVIVCIHNAFDDVVQCLDALEKNTRHKFRLILINDGSDPAMREYLDGRYSGSRDVHLDHREIATGYTKAANRGLKLSTADYVTLLNSDTVVTPGWEERLLTTGESASDVGIIGPLSNSATFQSVPEIRSADGDWSTNPLPAGLSPEDVANCVRSVLPGRLERRPFVNGFCFMIKRSVIEEVGFLDEESFPRGYGEENDYCIRTQDLGYSVGVACDAYVYHSLSRSFKHDSRKELQQHGRAALLEKHGADKLSRLLKLNGQASSDMQTIRKSVAQLYSQQPEERSEFPGTTVYSSIDDACHALGPAVTPRLRDFERKIFDNTLLLDFLGFVDNKEVPQLLNPVSGQINDVVGSTNVKNRFNIIEYSGNGDQMFLIQWVTFCDAIYFARENVVVLVHHVNEEAFNLCRANGAFARQFDNGPVFGGLIASNNRPYHYFYDVLPGLELAHNHFAGGPVFEAPVRSLVGGCYLDPRLIYREVEQMLSASSEMNNLSKKSGAFFCAVGVFGIEYNEHNRALTDSLHSRVRKSLASDRAHSSGDRIGIAFNLNRFKRHWVNQQESIVRLCRDLNDDYGLSVDLILDGWTLPVPPGAGDAARVLEDRAEVMQLQELLPDDTAIYSVVGMTVKEKIDIYGKCDLFVADHASASLLPSRLLGLPGVTVHNGLYPLNPYMHEDRVATLAGEPELLLEGRSSIDNPYNVDFTVDYDSLKLLVRTVIDREIEPVTDAAGCR